MEKFDQKPLEVAFSTDLRDNFRFEVARVTISSVSVEDVGVDVHVKFGDSTFNHFRDIQTTHFMMDERQRMDPVVIDRMHVLPINVMMTLLPFNPRVLLLLAILGRVAKKFS